MSASQPVDLSQLYSPLERQLLDAWLRGVAEPVDEAGTRLLDQIDGYEHSPEDHYSRLDAWVGAFVVRDIQERLPQWGLAYSDGTVVLGRKVDARRRSPKVASYTRRLFTINWADSGPGYSWPADYQLAWLPGFDRYVVAYCVDSTDMYGYCDLAMGHFAHSADPAERVRRAHDIIVGSWRDQQRRYDQDAWAYPLAGGLVSEEEALRWRDEVWGEPECEE